MRVTSGTRKVVFNGEAFACASIVPSERQLIENLDPSNMEIILPLDPGGIVERDLRGGKWNAARVDILFYDWNAGTIVSQWRGILSTSETNNGSLKAEVLDISVLSTQEIGDLYSDQCRTFYGSPPCGATPLTFSLAVVSVADVDEFTVTLTKTNDFFRYSTATFTTGNNTGRKIEVKSSTQEGSLIRVKLFGGMLADIAVGDVVTLSEGCDGKWETCIAKGRAKFFRGEPKIPGIYKILSWPQ